MEIKSVKLMDSGEQKSVQEIERELVEKHEQEQEQQFSGNQDESYEASDDGIANEQPEDDLTEEKVLSYIGKRYNKQISSFDELISERTQSEDLPEDVSAYLKYKKETGRGFDDFLKLREDFESKPEEELLREYLIATQEGLDEDDIEVMLDDYRYDEDYDDESYVKKTKIARKKAVNEAKKFFNEQKEKYKVPVEQTPAGISQEEKEEFEAYKEYMQRAKSYEEEDNRRRQWFQKKTEEVFGNNFKGFEFSFGDKKIIYSPGDAAELKKIHSNPGSFINKFLDENGLIKDAAGYHKALAIAMNPERFAKFFYEQGAAQAADSYVKQTKNINMSERKATESTKSNSGFQVKEVNPDHGKSLRIKSIKKL